MSNTRNHLLPPNATAAERAMAEAAGRMSDVPVPVGTLWDPWTCPAGALPWLAWALSVDVWDAAWPESTKRAVIAEALIVHRKKGTPWAVEQALRVAGAPDIALEEWFEFGGDPYYFRVLVSTREEGALTPGMVGRMMSDVAQFKNVRSWGALRITQEGDLAASWGAMTRYRPVVTVFPAALSVELEAAAYNYGCGVHVAARIDIF